MNQRTHHSRTAEVSSEKLPERALRLATLFHCSGLSVYVASSVRVNRQIVFQGDMRLEKCSTNSNFKSYGPH